MYPSVQKKVSLVNPVGHVFCTIEEQVTLHYMGYPHFHKWKIKWKFSKVPRDFTCSLYSFFVWPVTCRWHVPREITCEIQNFSNEFSLM